MGEWLRTRLQLEEVQVQVRIRSGEGREWVKERLCGGMCDLVLGSVDIPNLSSCTVTLKSGVQQGNGVHVQSG
jgi:hypothetical protein